MVIWIIIVYAINTADKRVVIIYFGFYLFRKQMEYRYRIMPYIYAQSIKASEAGIPVVRSMFVEFPEDRNCLGLEDQYMFGDDILVAPLFEDNQTERSVYLPEGRWIDLQNAETCYEGGRWMDLPAGELMGIALVREGAVLPMVDSALTTSKIDWNTLKYHWFTTDGSTCTGTGLDANSKKVFGLNTEVLKTLEVVKHEVK